MHRNSLAWLAILGVAAPLRAQQSRDTARVEPVVVSATRTPLTQGALPVAVTVITGDELRLRGVGTVADALADVTSAYVAQAGSVGATTSLFLRGGESKYVKVLIDGVPVNDPGGAYDFGALTTDNVERIEVVRGPASVIHGADAVTGVVNVITRRGAGPQRAWAEIRSGVAPRDRVVSARDPGRVALRALVAGTEGSAAGGAYSLSVGRQTSTGLYDVNNGFQANLLSGRFDFAATPATDVRATVRYSDDKYRYPTNSGGVAVDTNAYHTEDRTVIGVEAEHRISGGVRVALSLHSSVNDGGTDDERDDTASSSYVSQEKTRRRGAELRAQWLPSAGTALTAGAETEQQDQRSQFQSESPYGPFASRFSALRRNTAAYVEAVLTPTSNVTATLGGRVDDNQQFGTFGTGRGGVSFRPLAGTRLRATLGNAFREPSFFENYSTGFVTGNPGLRPERTLSADGGIDQDLAGARARLSLTAFAQRFRDMIDYTGGTSACGFSYCNVAQATSRGVEAELEATLLPALVARVGGTFLKTRVEEPGFDTSSAGAYRRGQPLLRRPERTVSADLTWRGAGPLAVNARLTAMGTRRDLDFTNYLAVAPVTLPSYERLDIGGEYALLRTTTQRLTASVRVENATNAGYQTVYNFLSPRRTVSVGLRAEW